MKKIITIALIAIISVSTYAQDRKERPRRPEGNSMKKFTPEQRNQLILKKMTLDLDLNASQQKEMSKIIAEQNAKREAHMKDRKAKNTKLTSDEIFEMKSKMLDEQIVMKGKMKKILSPEQFKEWDKMKHHHREGIRKNNHQDMIKNQDHRGMRKNMKYKDSTDVKK